MFEVPLLYLEDPNAAGVLGVAVSSAVVLGGEGEGEGEGEDQDERVSDGKREGGMQESN